MAASIRVTSHHTAGDDGSTTDVAGTAIFLKSSGDTDTNTSGVAHNGAGTNYSIVKNLKVYVQTGPIHLVNNLKWYWSGAAVTAIDVQGKVSATYVNPTTPPGDGTAQLTGTTSMYTYTSTAPLSQDGSFTTGTDTAPKFIGNFWSFSWPSATRRSPTRSHWDRSSRGMTSPKSFERVFVKYEGDAVEGRSIRVRVNQLSDGDYSYELAGFSHVCESRECTDVDKVALALLAD